MSFLERERIAVLHAQQCSVREIAQRLNRAPSTISRSCVETCAPATTGICDAGLARSRAREQVRRHRRNIFARDSALRQDDPRPHRNPLNRRQYD
ncbi:helix-turn-helix domain-containing protein [Rhodococcus jostii]|uniref:helix-turn-helix domain-containing protein n=1 Tax=Rhodococcus jostii TaxID=132919 RepID=UPI0035E94254